MTHGYVKEANENNRKYYGQKNNSELLKIVKLMKKKFSLDINLNQYFINKYFLIFLH